MRSLIAFHAELILGVLMLSLTAGAWWFARSRAERRLRGDLQEQINALRVEQARLRVAIDQRPDHDDLGRIYERLASMERTLQQLVGTVEARANLFDLLQNHLLGS